MNDKEPGTAANPEPKQGIAAKHSILSLVAYGPPSYKSVRYACGKYEKDSSPQNLALCQEAKRMLRAYERSQEGWVARTVGDVTDGVRSFFKLS